MASFSVSGQLIDLFARSTYPATVHVRDGKIAGIERVAEAPAQYLLPGFIDAHIHIESSMLVPTAFAQMAVVHGTVATVSDPHEIANVCGVAGVEYMIANAAQTPFKFFFGAPSCVPATGFETAGATLDAADVAALLARPDIWYLSEMMNYPGVLHQDPGVMAKIAAAQAAGKPVDGHAPGLMGDAAAQYAAAGISTDHECFTLAEALDKVACSMHILMREGSAARNLEALLPLLASHPERVMFCCDDKHPDELQLHHINHHVRRALAAGYELYDVLRAACVNPVLHYQLPVGMLRVGDDADFIVVDDLQSLHIQQTYINGQLVAEDGQSLLTHPEPDIINQFDAQLRTPQDFVLPADGATHIRVIVANEGQLVTDSKEAAATIVDHHIVSDTERDILKLVVVNRYQPQAEVAKAFISNFGLKQGAIASTIAHDCHNIVALGVDDASICAAVNALISAKGGIAVAENATTVQVLPLPIAGLISTEDCPTVATKYAALDAAAKALGCTLQAPFMTLSFMALLVIPSLKLSDKGLFDGKEFRFTSVTV